MSLNIQQLQTEEDGVHKFSLNGRLDGATARQLEIALRPALATNPKSIVLELDGLDFISSAGIRVLIETQNAMSAVGGSVLLVNLQPQIVKVLEIIKALPGITVFRNIEEMDDYLALMQRKVQSGE